MNSFNIYMTTMVTMELQQSTKAKRANPIKYLLAARTQSDEVTEVDEREDCIADILEINLGQEKYEDSLPIDTLLLLLFHNCLPFM